MAVKSIVFNVILKNDTFSEDIKQILLNPAHLFELFN
jgi:hypothetical protein